LSLVVWRVVTILPLILPWPHDTSVRTYSLLLSLTAVISIFFFLFIFACSDPSIRKWVGGGGRAYGARRLRRFRDPQRGTASAGKRNQWHTADTTWNLSPIKSGRTNIREKRNQFLHQPEINRAR
jgi:hypothetical protein